MKEEGRRGRAEPSTRFTPLDHAPELIDGLFFPSILRFGSVFNRAVRVAPGLIQTFSYSA